MEDLGIITLYFARDERAISETKVKYGRLCKSIALHIVEDEAEAEAIENETYFGLWQSIPPTRPASLCAFAAKVARNLSLKRVEHWQAQKRSALTVSLAELEEVLPDGEQYDRLEDRELGEWISEFLWQQREEVRLVFLRKYWFFDSIEDIAERFGCSASKIKSMLHHTRGKLKCFLAKKGVRI